MENRKYGKDESVAKVRFPFSLSWHLWTCASALGDPSPNTQQPTLVATLGHMVLEGYGGSTRMWRWLPRLATNVVGCWPSGGGAHAP